MAPAIPRGKLSRQGAPGMAPAVAGGPLGFAQWGDSQARASLLAPA